MLKKLRINVLKEIIEMADNLKLASENCTTRKSVTGNPSEQPIEYYRSKEKVAIIEKLNSLTNEELSELIALMWLGRGQNGWSNDWDAMVESTNISDFSKSSDIQYVVAKSIALPNYLRQGAIKLKLI